MLFNELDKEIDFNDLIFSFYNKSLTQKEIFLSIEKIENYKINNLLTKKQEIILKEIKKCLMKK